MSESLQVALGVGAIVLLALLIGAVLPVLFEARATLRQARKFLDHTGRRLDAALDETNGLVGKVNRLAGELEPRARALAASLDEAHRVLKVVVAIGAAVGPAVAAGIQAFQAVRENAQEGSEPGGHEAPGPDQGG